MSKKIYILHHLGLGDHFHCNGVVRSLLKEKYKDTKVILFAKQKYLEMVQFMYRDLLNLKVISISNDEKKEQEEINFYLNEEDKIERIGFDYFLENKHKNKTIDMLFYEQFNIDYSQRFNLTYWERDTSNEEKLYDKLIDNKNYIFIHDDPSRGFIIPEKFISKEFQIIKNSYNYSIFDYSKIIENAKEIHVMESSARCMLEYLNTENSKHFLYNFIDGPWKSIPYYNQSNEIIGSSKKWKVVNIAFKKKIFLKRYLIFKFKIKIF